MENKIQKLQSKNTLIKNEIIKVLKTNLSISKKQVKTIFLENSPLIGNHGWFGVGVHNLGYHNYKTIVNYLIQNNLVTKEIINGFWFLVATKKLVHTHISKL